jgi:hypothetical protein
MVGDRRTGPLFTDRKGQKAIDRSSVSEIVERAARNAGIQEKVLPRHLLYTLPTVALDHGFSYVSVMRATGVIQTRHSSRWLYTGDRSDEENASLRLARMVFHPPDSAENWLVHTEALLRETDVPEQVTVMTAGAVIERHLRLLAVEHGIPPQSDSSKGGISYYVGELQRRKVMRVPDAREFRALGDLRNDAAHGWFERVPPGSGIRALRDARELIARYPLTNRAD